MPPDRPARRIWAVMAAGLLGLAGCTVGPDYHRTDLALPLQWQGRAESAAESAAAAARLRNWWTAFHDPELDRLVAAALAGNDDLAVARARIRMARAEIVIADSETALQLGGLADASANYSATTLTWPPGIGYYRYYTAGFDASFEIDLFGGARRSVEAAKADAESVAEQRNALQVSLLGEVARDYLSYRTAEARLGVARAARDAARSAAHLADLAFARGLGTDLATAQAQTQLQSADAALPPLRAEAARAAHALAELVGQTPNSLDAELEATGAGPIVPPDLPPTLPAETIANRPDVREAERELAAATARIGVATANLYPHLVIPLTLAPETSYLSEAFRAASLVYSAGPSLTAPILTGGRLSAQLRQARDAAETRRVLFHKSVLTALREVEDALITDATDTDRARSLHAASAAATKAFARAERLYRAGLSPYLTVLIAEQQRDTAADAAIRADFAGDQDRVALFKALGGGWQAP